MSAWKTAIDALQSERDIGGSESPCPFCKVPRVKRSDYTRCCRCGINWMTGENLNRDPRIERLGRFLEDTQRTQRKKEPS